MPENTEKPLFLVVLSSTHIDKVAREIMSDKRAEDIARELRWKEWEEE